MMIVGEMKMADALLENHFLLLVIERFGISYGLKDKTIGEVCKQYDINVEVFLSVANLNKGHNSLSEVDYSSNDIIKIVEYLKISHDYYSNEVLPGISERIKSLSSNNNNLVFNLIEQFFNEYIQEVVKHLKHEESTVYPYALSLIKDPANADKYSMSDYKEHHDDIESKLDDLKNLLIKHLNEQNDHKFRRRILFDLFRFETDLKIHTIIEESILVPYIENIENTLLNPSAQ